MDYCGYYHMMSKFVVTSYYILVDDKLENWILNNMFHVVKTDMQVLVSHCMIHHLTVPKLMDQTLACYGHHAADVGERKLLYSTDINIVCIISDAPFQISFLQLEVFLPSFLPFFFEVVLYVYPPQIIRKF